MGDSATIGTFWIRVKWKPCTAWKGLLRGKLHWKLTLLWEYSHGIKDLTARILLPCGSHETSRRCMYDNLNQVPASQKEGHEFTMISQLHNQYKGLLKMHVKYCQGRFYSWHTQFTITNVLSTLIKFKLNKAEHLFVICFIVHFLSTLCPRHYLKM